MATFPLYREELADELGVTVQWVEDLHYGMPCSRRVGDGTWWVDDEAALAVWRTYADVWLNPPSTDLSPILSAVDLKGSGVEEVSRPLPPFGQPAPREASSTMTATDDRALPRLRPPSSHR